MTLRNFNLIVFSLTVFFLTACSEETVQSEQVNVTVSDLAPELVPEEGNTETTFQDLAGNGIELSDFAGKRVLLNYWATWCGPCIREIPALNRAASILADEGYIVLLASDEGLQEIAEFIQQHEFSGNFIKLNAYFAEHGVQAVPSTVLYNEESEIINRWLGAYEWDSNMMLREMRESGL